MEGSSHAKNQFDSFIRFDRKPTCDGQTDRHRPMASVGFVAAAVSKPMGGCRARRSLVVDVDVAAELAVL